MVVMGDGNWGEMVELGSWKETELLGWVDSIGVEYKVLKKILVTSIGREII